MVVARGGLSGSTVRAPIAAFGRGRRPQAPDGPRKPRAPAACIARGGTADSRHDARYDPGPARGDHGPAASDPMPAVRL